jgi:D-alanyl-D-alanine-carboxypeptidase/D-alanyl-D-alanine-endopeptidase
VNDKNPTGMTRGASRRAVLFSGGSVLFLLASSSLAGVSLAAPAVKARPVPVKNAPPPPFVPSGPAFPSDAEIQRIVDDRVVTFHDAVGLIVGVVDPTGRRLFARGPAQVGNDDPVDGETIFEIGGITKAFTALLLTDMAHRGELSLTDPAVKYLPPGTILPQRGARPISLLDFATHTSGLPKMPANVIVTDFNNPGAEMTVDQLLKSVGAYELTRDVGTGYEYSDAGYDVLGLVEANVGHTDFETLLKSRVFGPLHMTRTRIASSLDEKDKMSAGYDQHLTPVPHSRVPGLMGAVGMRSTANDLLDFVAANAGLTNTPLAPAMADMLKIMRPTQLDARKVAIGWHVVTVNGADVVFSNGQTEGYRAFIGFSPKNRAGIVVLSNSADTIDDIGGHLLNKDIPLRTLYREVEVKPSVFDNYLGRYQVGDKFSLNITRDGNHLYIQVFGQPRAELFARGDDQFFLRVVDAQVDFHTDGGGRASSMTLTQDGKSVTALLVQ